MKINDELLIKIKSFTKEFLLQNPYEKLTMRLIAGKFDISVGTLYNCFESKEILVAKIVLEDWMKITDEVEKSIESFGSCIEGLQFLFERIREFNDTHIGIFNGFPTPVNLNGERHEMLIAQISALIRKMLARFGLLAEPDPSDFLAENLLAASRRENLKFEDIQVFLERVINNN